jgi:hypothetical protein
VLVKVDASGTGLPEIIIVRLGNHNLEVGTVEVNVTDDVVGIWDE